MRIYQHSKITELLKSEDLESRKRGYDAFLMNTHWFKEQSPEGLRRYACAQFHIPEKKVTFSEIKMLNPKLLWSSQDSLEQVKIDMVHEASAFFNEYNLEFPPILVWNFYESQTVRLVVHDGHHRAYCCNEHGLKIKAVILEPIGDYNKIEKKHKLAFQIRKRVIDLPIFQNDSFSNKETSSV